VAISFATASDWLVRTTGLLDCKNGPATVMMWVKQDAHGAGYKTHWIQLDSPGTYQDYIWLGERLGADEIKEEQSNAGVIVDTPFVARAPDVWFHHTLVRTSISGTVWYINGLVFATNVENMTGTTLAEEYIGNDTLSDGGVTVAYAREWDAILTSTEIQTEMQSATVMKTANLWADWSFDADINDASGNGRNWTQVGSGTFVDPPEFPTNNTQANALALTGSDSLTPDFADGFIAWYSYIPSSVTEDVLSFFCIATLSDTITSRTFGPAQAAYPSSGSIAGENKPIQIPLLDGTTVYIRVFLADNLTAPATLTTRRGPNNDTPIGTILINDDTDGFPLAMLSETTGLPLRFMNPFPIGEMVAVLNDGTILLEDSPSLLLRLFDPDLNIIGSVAYPWGAGDVGALNSDRETTFYASKFGGTVAYQMDITGTVTDTFTVAAAISLMCPNRDNTILYYVQAGVNQAIRCWDLVNDVALPNLVAGVANHFAIKNMLVLADDTILVGYGKSSATTDYFVRHYSAAGATLNTYVLSDTTEKINWIQLGINDDSSSFLIWSFPTVDVTSRFTYITVSDGSVLSETPIVPIYEGGVYQPPAALVPDSYFGHSKSCPVWVLAVAQAPPENVTVREYLIRRERWFPVVSQEQRRLFFHKLQLYFESGTGINDGQGSNPLVELDWSDDGGHTWSNLHLLESGPMGQYKRRIIQRMMGQSRERIYRVAVSDPVQWSLIDAFFDLTQGTS
jgi:hypothetical protein